MNLIILMNREIHGEGSACYVDLLSTFITFSNNAILELWWITLDNQKTTLTFVHSPLQRYGD